MKKIIKSCLIAFLLLLVSESGNSQITKTKFQIEYDEDNCWYNFYVHILEGSAIDFLERIPLLNSVTLILPIESQATMLESITPNTTSWTLSNVNAYPGGDEDKNFLRLFQGSGNLNVYPEMNEGDTILLCRFSVDNDVQGVKGIREYINGMDDPGGGGAYGSSFVFFGLDTHQGYLDPIFGSEYAQATGPAFIYVDKKTSLFPTTGGTWSQTNSSATAFDQATNEITGLAPGRSMFTFSPNNGSCETSVMIEVLEVQDSLLLAGNGEGEFDPASKLTINGSKGGFLIPRLDAEARQCMIAPAPGLMIYQTDEEIGFYYFSGQSWFRLTNTDAEGSSSQNMVVQNEELKALQAKQTELLQQIEAQEQELIELSKKILDKEN